MTMKSVLQYSSKCSSPACMYTYVYYEVQLKNLVSSKETMTGCALGLFAWRRERRRERDRQLKGDSLFQPCLAESCYSRITNQHYDSLPLCSLRQVPSWGGVNHSPVLKQKVSFNNSYLFIAAKKLALWPVRDQKRTITIQIRFVRPTFSTTITANSPKAYCSFNVSPTVPAPACQCAAAVIQTCEGGDFDPPPVNHWPLGVLWGGVPKASCQAYHRAVFCGTVVASWR